MVTASLKGANPASRENNENKVKHVTQKPGSSSMVRKVFCWSVCLIAENRTHSTNFEQKMV